MPEYICRVARGIMRSGRAKQTAIQMAIGRMKVWAAGGGNVKADTRAKAAAAVAEWEKMKMTAQKLAEFDLESGDVLLLSATLPSFSLEGVKRAWDAQQKGESGQVTEVWTDAVVVQNPDASYDRIPFEFIDGAVTFGDPQRVTMVAVPVDLADEVLEALAEGEFEEEFEQDEEFEAETQAEEATDSEESEDEEEMEFSIFNTEDMIELSTTRRVRTAAGAKFYGAPIGTPIVKDPVTGAMKALVEGTPFASKTKRRKDATAKMGPHGPSFEWLAGDYGNMPTFKSKTGKRIKGWFGPSDKDDSAAARKWDAQVDDSTYAERTRRLLDDAKEISLDDLAEVAGADMAAEEKKLAAIVTKQTSEPLPDAFWDAFDADAEDFQMPEQAKAEPEQEEGWGPHRPAGPDYGSPLWAVDAGIYPSDIYTDFRAVDYYGSGDPDGYRRDSSMVDRIRRMQGRPTREVKIYRAIPKDAKSQWREGDWVTMERSYAVEHGRSALNGDYKIISKTVPAYTLWTEGNSLQEWGYHPEASEPKIAYKDDFARWFARARKENPGLSRQDAWEQWKAEQITTDPEQGTIPHPEKGVNPVVNVRNLEQRAGSVDAGSLTPEGKARVLGNRLRAAVAAARVKYGKRAEAEYEALVRQYVSAKIEYQGADDSAEDYATRVERTWSNIMRRLEALERKYDGTAMQFTRRIRTPEGAKFYGAPIGTPIVRDRVTGKLKAATAKVAPAKDTVPDLGTKRGWAVSEKAKKQVEQRDAEMFGTPEKPAGKKPRTKVQTGQQREEDVKKRADNYPGEGTPKDPKRVSGDIEAAALLLSEGKSIRLESEMEAGTLLDKLRDVVKHAESLGQKAPDFDLCKVSVPGTNLFCSQHKGIPRAEMPQFKGKDKDGNELDVESEWRTMLEDKGIKITRKTVPASELKASQMQLDGPKVAGMAGALADPKLPKKNRDGITAPIFVTRDGYVLDGHHRWAAIVATDLDDGSMGDLDMQVDIIDIEIGEAIDLANAFTRAKGIVPKGTGKDAEGKGLSKKEKPQADMGETLAALRTKKQTAPKA